MRRIKLTRQERGIEEALMQGEYLNVDRLEFDEIVRAVAHRRKDAVLNIRVNRDDVETIKQKAKKLGVRYQTFLSELIHRVAHS